MKVGRSIEINNGKGSDVGVDENLIKYGFDEDVWYAPSSLGCVELH